MKKAFIPLILFFAMALLLAIGLNIDPKLVPSPFIGKAAPTFSLPTLADRNKNVGPKDMMGKVWILNVWASWCVSCRAEHEVLTQAIEQLNLPALGLNYKDYGQADYGDDAKTWLKALGNPYSVVAVDSQGQAGLDWGVYGVPETFVIDQKGIIRHKFTGPVVMDDISRTLAPLVTQLRQEAQ